MKLFLETTWDILKKIILVALVAWVIKGAAFQPFIVDGTSMEPNFHDKEYLLVNKLSFKIRPPKRGDVVIFIAPDNPQYDYIKRVIGLPGETVLIRNNKVYINDNLLDEKYLSSDIKTVVDQDEDATLTRTLGQNEYFVMGDNRPHSTDSRSFGVLPKTNLVGRAWLALFPNDVLGFVKAVQYNYGS